MERVYTITVFSEHQTGILQRVVTVFTRRHINIESLTVSKSAMEGIHRFTIVVQAAQPQIEMLVAQLEKQVDVLKAYYYTDEEIVYQEIALYKVPMQAFASGRELEQLVRSHNARILEIEYEYIVIEKCGHQDETENLLEALREYGIYEFVRSGRVAVVKPMEPLARYLTDLERGMQEESVQTKS